MILTVHRLVSDDEIGVVLAKLLDYLTHQEPYVSEAADQAVSTLRYGSCAAI